VHWTGGYAPRFQAFSLAQISSVKMSLSCPSRQPVTRAVGQLVVYDVPQMKTKAIITAFLITTILASCSPDAAVSPTPQATIPSPITFSGEGNAYLTINKWRGPALIHITYTGSDEFIAWNDNEKQRQLEFVLHVNSNYAGTQVLDMSDQESFQTHY